MANPLDFLQLTPENIAQAKGMSWGQALKTEIPGSSTYRGFNPAYKGAGATGLGGYIKSGLQSLTGNVPASGGVGGATPLTRKLALSAMDYAPKALGIASRFLGPASFLFNATPANADEINMTAEDFQNLALQNQTQPIDPTGKNLFTQYYEDDPYAGIAGQTAMLDPFSIFMMTQAGLGKKQIMGQIARKEIQKNLFEDIETKKAEEEAKKAQQQATIAANREAAKKFGDKPQPIYHQETKSQDRGGRDIGSRVSDSYEKQQSAQYGMLAKGGLVNFFKYGGFLG